MAQSIIGSSQEIHQASTKEQLKECYPIALQLRPHLEEQSFIEQVQRQIADGYQLIYIKEDGTVRALAGFRFLEFLAWGKVLYIDDLITDTASRGRGYGSQLLKWIIEQAQEQNCDQVHLDSGPQRHNAHRLYLNHGFKLNSHHFALDFLNR